MRKFGLLLITFCILTAGFAQEQELDKKDVLEGIDTKYREDQFYFVINHNIMEDKPKGYSPNSISLGLDVGFLRDFPVNKQRTLAIAPGFGYSYENLHHNFGIDKQGNYLILESYKTNRLSMHLLDFPIELRWRNSTPESHKFWRTYIGFKASYLLSANHKTVTDSYSVNNNTKDKLNKWLFGVYVGAGFNTWNLYLYYGLNTLYKNEPIVGDPEKMRMFKVGLIFYIL